MLFVSTPSQAFSVLNYGAIADSRTVTDGAINATQSTLSSASAAFSAADAGKIIFIAGAGGGGAPYAGTILSVTSGVATVSTPAGTSVTNASVTWGTNNTTAFTAAMTAALAAKPAAEQCATVYIPPGVWQGQLILQSNCYVVLDRASTVDWCGAGNPATINDSGGIASNCGVLGYGTIKGTSTSGCFTQWATSFQLELRYLSGLNGGFYSNGGHTLYAKIDQLGYPGTIQGLQLNGGTNYLEIGICQILQLSSNATVYCHCLKTGLNASAFGIYQAGGFLEFHGNVFSATSDAAHLEGGGTQIIHGNLTSAGDCGAYCQDAGSVQTIFGDVTATGTNYNLVGRGNGACIYQGSGANGSGTPARQTIHGNVTGCIGAVNGEGIQTIVGTITSNAAGNYASQGGVVRYVQYTPNDVASLGGCAAINIGAATSYWQNVSSAYNCAVKVFGPGGSVRLGGPITATATGASTGFPITAEALSQAGTATGSTTLTLTNTGGLTAGMTVTGTGISGGTTISSVNVNGTQLTLSATATAGSNTYSFGGGSTITLSNTELNAGSGVSDVISATVATALNVLGETYNSIGSATPANVTFRHSGSYNIAGTRHSP